MSRNRSDFGQVEMTINLKDVLIHPHYDQNTFKNDIALIKLPQSLNTSLTQIQPACLPSFNEIYDTKCEIGGWASSGDGRNFPIQLWSDQVTTMNNKICKQALNSSYVYDTHICGKYPKPKIDQCKGNSGSPLMCHLRNGLRKNWVLTGITSWNVKCTNGISVYSQISKYLTWLVQVTDGKIAGGILQNQNPEAPSNAEKTVILQGIPGPPGLKGEHGDIGLKGASIKGEPGLKGEKGEIGLKGRIGFRGYSGFKGQKGDRGLQGIKGEFGSMSNIPLINDCSETSKIGPATLKNGMQVFCEGGWTRIARYRLDDNLRTNRSYEEYKQGFGSVKKSHWLGLEKIGKILKLKRNKKWSLQLTLQNGTLTKIIYKQFNLDVNDNYRLTVTDFVGTLNDTNVLDCRLNAPAYLTNGLKFSAYDYGFDTYNKSHTGCSREAMAGWWWQDCGRMGVTQYTRGKVAYFYTCERSFKVYDFSEITLEIKPNEENRIVYNSVFS